MGKTFMGVGLVNAVLITFFVIFLLVVLKTVMVKYPVPGLSEVIQAA